jgi:hypothetical protein
LWSGTLPLTPFAPIAMRDVELRAGQPSAGLKRVSIENTTVRSLRADAAVMVWLMIYSWFLDTWLLTDVKPLE